jgi:hypothetical protein
MEDNVVKITNAVYAVLEFFPDADPLKNKVKEKALAVLENIALVSKAPGWVSLQKEKASAELLDDIEVLKNYLAVAKDQGWINTMDFFIITKGYNKVKSSIVPPQGLIRKSMEIAQTFAKELPHEREDVALENNQMVVTKPLEQAHLSLKALTRQEKILQILTKKEKAQVSDFIKEIPSITKRTVRRDLNDLLKNGKVTRTGEWNQVFYKISDRT